ncbi:GntR family transcriptional regulator [Microbacterium sp. SSW1-49]|uniref:GntR family transcriptional regulator n=1 Tax=Microbacterium croceum TaxID=2851645 RepID=A0ABT0FA18_9MICO|nr:GntR family transcriptional regulator [Microbacterium croceum]MCK2034903.1 GntR family transcriptional regulator [Microbacterium croceum]
MDLSERPGDAARRRLTLLLRAAITRGDHPERLPTDDEIAATYDVSRAVARDALTALADVGILTRTRGAGTLPTDNRPTPFNLLTMPAVGGVPQYSMHPRVIDVATVPTPTMVAARLPTAGSEVLRVEYISVPDDQADGVSTGYFVLPKAEPLRTADFGENVYSFLAAGGLGVSATDFVIGAITAGDALALRLRTRSSSAVLFLEQTIYDEAGDPLSFSVVAMRGDRLAVFSHAHS